MNAALTRAERLHNRAVRVLQVVGVACSVGSFWAEYHSAKQWALVLGGLLLMVIASVRGQYVEEVEGDE